MERSSSPNILSCISKSFESGRFLQYMSTICTAKPSKSGEENDCSKYSRRAIYIITMMANGPIEEKGTHIHNGATQVSR